MRRTSTRLLVRTGAAVTVLLLGATVAPGPAGARRAGAPPPAVDAASLGGSINVYESCTGQQIRQPNFGLLKVERPNATSGTLSVDVSYSGSLVADTDYPALPDPVVIAVGETATFLDVKATKAGTVTLTVEPGSGYTVGSPASATTTISETVTKEVCRPELSQTIFVGQHPADIKIDDPFGGALGDTEFHLAGTLPPGTTYGQAPDSGWGGAATTPGTYRVVYTYCLGATSPCVLEQPLRILVLPQETLGPPSVTNPPTAPPAAPPAAPLPSTATFTG